MARFRGLQVREIKSLDLSYLSPQRLDSISVSIQVKRIAVSKDELELVINRQAWVLDNDAGSDASP